MRTLKTIQKLLDVLSMKVSFCTPLYFRGDEPNLDELIKEKKERLLAAGVPISQINKMPIFCEGELYEE